MDLRSNGIGNLLLAGIFLLSLSTLALEILLARIFSISQWNHLAFMVISIALFGFAASGTWLSILAGRSRQSQDKAGIRESGIRSLLLAYSLSAVGGILLLDWLPLDYYQIFSQPVQILYLLVAYLSLALPFFFAGTLAVRAYMGFPERSGSIYLVAMSGSALGAALPIVVLSHLDEYRLALIMAILPLALVVPPTRHHRQEKCLDSRIPVWGSRILLLGVLVLIFFPQDDLLRMAPSPYKKLSQMLRHPDAALVASASGIDGRIDRLQSPQIRFAPGLSLKYTDSLPHQEALYTDGDDEIVLYQQEEEESFSFTQQSLNWAGYRLAAPVENVLVILKNGGSAIPAAITSGAARITVVHPNAIVTRTLEEYYDRAGVKVVASGPRAFVRADGGPFDIIQVENSGARLPGTAGLTMDHGFTRQAFAEYLDCLRPSGVLMISRRLLLPPASSLRMWSTAYESLANTGASAPYEHMLMLRNWDIFVLLVKKTAFSSQERTLVKEFAKQLNFDLVDDAAMGPKDANRFNQLDQPYYYLAISRLKRAYAQGLQAQELDDYLLDTVSQGDQRPYPERYLKWPRIKDLYKTLGSRMETLMLSGEIIVAIVFVEALLITLVLMLLPAVSFQKAMQPTSHRSLIFFLGIGSGFILMEIFFIKAFTLIYGEPVKSFAMVLCGYLLFSSLGGALSRYVARHYLPLVLCGLAAATLMAAFTLIPLTRLVLSLPQSVHTMVVFILLAPPGILAGIPFSVGMRHLATNSRLRALCWAANGCASVLAAIAATQIAVSWGLSAIMATACLSYCLALLGVGRNPDRNF